MSPDPMRLWLPVMGLLLMVRVSPPTLPKASELVNVVAPGPRVRMPGLPLKATVTFVNWAVPPPEFESPYRLLPDTVQLISESDPWFVLLTPPAPATVSRALPLTVQSFNAAFP